MIDKIFVTPHRLGTNSLILEDFKLYGDVWHLPAGPIAFAIGSEHRTERETDQPDSLLVSGQTTGAINFPPAPSSQFLPARGSRDVWSIYWEVRVPVTSSVWNSPGFHSLELGYQERYDDYSDFGSTERPKFFFRWQPIDSSLTLRGTYNEAYHVPTLGELFTSQVHETVFVPDPAGLTPHNAVEATIGGNPNLNAEQAYEWTYGAAWTPAKFIKGLTLSADFYHIDLRNTAFGYDIASLITRNFVTRTGTLPNGAPTGGVWSDLIQRDPVTGAILSVNTLEQNVTRLWNEGLDYEATYQLDTSIFGRGDFGTFNFTVNGNYLSRVVWQPSPTERRVNVDGQFLGPRRGSFPQNRWYMSLFYDLGGLDAGATVHFIGQMSDLVTGGKATNFQGVERKIREWATLDLILNYTFNFTASVAQNQVAGYASDGGKNAGIEDGKGRNILPVSTAEYSSGAWRGWLNHTTITLGMNNVLDQDPPFAFGGYDQRTANIRGRTWYVALTKRF